MPPPPVPPVPTVPPPPVPPVPPPPVPPPPPFVPPPPPPPPFEPPLPEPPPLSLLEPVLLEPEPLVGELGVVALLAAAAAGSSVVVVLLLVPLGARAAGRWTTKQNTESGEFMAVSAAVVPSRLVSITSICSGLRMITRTSIANGTLPIAVESHDSSHCVPSKYRNSTFATSAARTCATFESVVPEPVVLL